MKGLEKYADQLNDLHKSALPVAIRSALNSAAFDVKKNTMPDSAKDTFTQRKPNFFKANSTVQPAKGFQIESMKAMVGFVPKDKAVEELEQQEEGGVIKNRALIPMDTARPGNSNKRMVRSNARLQALKSAKTINAHKVKAGSKKQKFVRAAIMAKKLYGSNAFVLGNVDGGKQTLSKINSITFNKKKRTIKIKRTPLYTYRRGNKEVRVARTNFMKRAAHESGLKIERHFVNAAIKQFKKYAQKHGLAR